MAFSLRNLSVLAYANGFTLWHYKAGNDNFVQTMGAGILPMPLTCSARAIW
jgi:hypothetical protein